MEKRLYRTETGLWFNAVLCTSMFAIPLIAYWGFGHILGLWVYVIMFICIVAVPTLVLCVLPKMYLKHWYIEFSDEGFSTNTLGIKRFYPWKEILNIDSEQSPEFTGRYHDILIIETEKKQRKYFLPNWGLHKKKETNEYHEAIKKAWIEHQKQQAS